MSVQYKREYNRTLLAQITAALLVWGALIALTAAFTGAPLGRAFGQALSLLCGFMLLWFAASWLQGRFRSGRLLADLGPHPMRFMFLLLAALQLYSAATRADDHLPNFTLAVYFLWLVLSRRQLRENGVWDYLALLPWARVAAHGWNEDGSLWLRSKSGFYIASDIAVPLEHCEAIEARLAERLPLPTHDP